MKVVNAPAKINLFLKIFDKKDGYHMLDSALAFLDLYDVITFTRSRELKVDITGPYSHLVNNQENILIDVVKLFQQKFKITDSVKINLTKNIPVGGGLGGGSSNSAELIKYFNEEYSLGLTCEELQLISFNFGSDIAFFLQDKAAIIKNRGEVVACAKNFSEQDVILICPDFGLSTKEVFAEFNGNFSNQIDLPIIKKASFGKLLCLGNDLTEIAIKIQPKLGEILKFIDQLDDVNYCNMSGSGSTLFAIIDRNIKENSDLITKEFKDCKVINTVIKFNND